MKMEKIISKLLKDQKQEDSKTQIVKDGNALTQVEHFSCKMLKLVSCLLFSRIE